MNKMFVLKSNNLEEISKEVSRLSNNGYDILSICHAGFMNGNVEEYRCTIKTRFCK